MTHRRPPELKVNVLTDQSLFVKAAINGVVREGAIAAALTSLMILCRPAAAEISRVAIHERLRSR
jgi:multidrug efflux pump subunit AcrB